MPTPPTKTPQGREELQKRLAELDRTIPELLASYPEQDDFWNAFAGVADFATEGAGSDDYEWVNARVDDLLRKHGVQVPSDQAPGD